ncbi:DNA repair protein XRCC4-like [Amphiura filiformis]|uniref:DNA repair protein XRCC4-like n=1 Tax=Amphiura filiformis TaxID=82378 RepID=UPI003B213D0F
MDQTVLSRVDVGRQPYFLQTTLLAGGNAGFRLLMTDALNAWTAEIPESDLDQLAKKVSMERKEFIDVSKKALTQMELGSLAFEYTVQDLDDGAKEFSWKKVMTTGNIKFQLGCLTMEPVDDPSESIQDLLIFSIGHVSTLREDIRRLEMEDERLSTERSNALKRLEKCVSLKEELEQDLYSKFQIVLNDKKAKIRGLKEEVKETKAQLEDALENATASNRPGSSREGVSPQSSHGDGSEEEMDISDEDTDDERKKAKEPLRIKKRSQATAAAPLRDSGDSSLLLGEEEEDQPATTNKRRRRREPQKKDTGPQKPAVPRVPSNS